MTVSERISSFELKDYYTAFGGNFAEFKKNALELFLSEEYGFLPDKRLEVSYKRISEDKVFCAGKAPLEKIEMTVTCGNKSHAFPFFVMIPKSETRLPFFVHINFRPNVPDKYLPSEELCDNGYAVLSFCYNDVTSDDGDFTNGLAGLLYENGERGLHDCGKIHMWAWAASRVMDYALTREELDGERGAVIGHSRLGKTALLTGALDGRFELAVSNCSGCSGASLQRSRTEVSEKIADIVKNFPYWFCKEYACYAGKEDELPFDQHLLIALNLPHKVYVGSAAEDFCADPDGEFLSCVAAGEVAEKAGFENAFVHGDRMPECGESFHDGIIGYHLRPGQHYFSREDWLRVIAFRKGKE